MNKKWLNNKFITMFVIAVMAIIMTLSGCGESKTRSLPEPVAIPETIEETTTEEVTTEEETTTKSLEESTFEVHFIDVDQGDSILVICNDEAMLIDGGPSDKSDVIYAYLKDKKIEHLKYIIATHPEEDHVGGLSGALNYATVDMAYTSKIDRSKEAFEEFQKNLEKQNVTLQIPSEGTTFSLGIASGIIMRPKDLNKQNASLVVRVEFGDVSFLFMGDANSEEEQELINSGVDLKSTVLKVGHHGAEDSTSEAFMNMVMPKYAVISCGQKNLYGHPTDAALNTLQTFGVELYRTDMQGNIICSSDGYEVSFVPERNADSDIFLTYHELYEPETTTEAVQKVITEEVVVQEEPEGYKPANTYTYILNTNTYKFHSPFCRDVKKMADYNKLEYNGTRDEVIAMGYSPCGHCHP